MELRHLRYFKVLAETLNFTRAAELLHIAQPPLSRQISQLEDQLGTLLVVRERPLRLTEAGRFFYEQTCTVLQQLQNISDNTRRIGQGQRQWLGIGFAPSTLYTVLPELIRELRQDSELELGLNEMTTLQQVEALARRRGIALAVLPGDGRPDERLDAVSTVPDPVRRRLGQLCDSGGMEAARSALATLAQAAGLATMPLQDFQDSGLPPRRWCIACPDGARNYS